MVKLFYNAGPKSFERLKRCGSKGGLKDLKEIFKWQIKWGLFKCFTVNWTMTIGMTLPNYQNADYDTAF